MKVLLLGRDNFDYTNILKTIYNNGDECTIFINNFSPDAILDFDFIISYNYPMILGKEILDKFKNRIVNLHISYLPWNRGADPNLWSWIDNTPKGVSIHQIDEGIDTGDILDQAQVFFNELDYQLTLNYTWKFLQEEIQWLFKETWSKIRTHKLTAKSQVGNGSFHLLRQRPKLTEGWDTKVADL